MTMSSTEMLGVVYVMLLQALPGLIVLAVALVGFYFVIKHAVKNGVKQAHRELHGGGDHAA